LMEALGILPATEDAKAEPALTRRPVVKARRLATSKQLGAYLRQ
ncbi:hypothetical protein T12_10218, partial [Trichinella patagoniensis]